MTTDYRLSVEERPGYLCFRVDGEDNVETAVAYLSEVLRISREKGCPNVLILENLRGPGLGIGDVFRVIMRAVWPAVPHLRVVAYVDINPEHEFRSMKFAETVARNRGLFVRVFADPEEAQAWIEEQVKFQKSGNRPKR